MATILPLTDVGAISAMYIGDNIDAIPTPDPATKRAMMKLCVLEEKAIASDDNPNMAAAVNKPFLRPNFSEMVPAIRHPKIAPKARLPVANPSQ